MIFIKKSQFVIPEIPPNKKIRSLATYCETAEARCKEGTWVKVGSELTVH